MVERSHSLEFDAVTSNHHQTSNFKIRCRSHPSKNLLWGSVARRRRTKRNIEGTSPYSDHDDDTKTKQRPLPKLGTYNNSVLVELHCPCGTGTTERPKFRFLFPRSFLSCGAPHNQCWNDGATAATTTTTATG